MAAPPSFTFTPAPEEQAYYAALFDVADSTRSGALAGKEAVTFMATSGVPMETLKSIWGMVDNNPKTGSLDHAKFYNAVRMIQLHQNGQRPQDPTLAAPPGVVMKPAMFEGVSGVSVPLPGSGQPPPQQQQPMQQQPPPASMQQQQQQQPMMAPPMQQGGLPPMQQQQQQQPPPPQTMAMTAQDPYVMYPQEQSRYEDLFPQYESKKDGYVYGAEAVGLFSKSGADKAALRQIWNMADDPVDNRLSKLEFAIAMHLIVCITKKNLPVPASLPPSLKALKDQEAGGAPQQQQQQQQMPPPIPPSPARSIPGQMPPPQLQQPQQQQQQAPPPMMPSMGLGGYQQQAPPSPVPQQPIASSSMSIPSPTAGGGMQVPPSPMPSYGQGMMSTQQQQQMPPQQPSLGGPPPLTAPGGASISDAFEGLAPGPSTSSIAGSASYNVPPSPVASASAARAGPPSVVVPTEPEAPVSAAGAPPVPDIGVAVPTPVAANGTAGNKPSYQTGSDDAELSKLRATLQKLQAENISLKAKLGDVTEEEADVRKEIGETVAEIGRLSQELTGLREKVADAKAALIEATAELKAQKEKKGMVTDLIGEANQTLDALADAHSSIGDLQATDDRLEKQEEERNAAGNAFESGLFDGFGDAPAAEPEPAPTPAPAPAETTEAAPAPIPVTSTEPEHPVLEAQQEPQTQNTYGAPESTQDAYHSGVMGGPASGAGYASTEQHTMIPMGGMSPATAGPSSLNPDSFGHSSSGVALSFSADEIDAMKQQVTELDRKAVSAEDSQRQLMAEVDVLRREAEQAEVLAAEKVSAAEGTKKKRFGKSGKKGAAKEAEAARAAALEKKKRAEAAQTALNNAQAEAIKAKRQAEELRQQAEEAELQAASAASMMPDQQSSQQADAAAPPAPAVPQMEASYSGYASAPPPMGYMPDNKPMGEAPGGMSNGHGMAMGGIGMQQQQMQSQPPMAMMGGGAHMGGIPDPVPANGNDGGIPAPSASQQDDYSNPFGGW
mmetsp:Transcript_27096/g.58772  ORF Transcript_27096/g.58772 Transcript_27096/m.58772 type:complete len:1005 (+) Transcript_27096:150-3164(+)